MNTHKIEALEGAMADAWETPDNKWSGFLDPDNVKKQYNFGQYVRLSVLNEPTKEGYKFIVYYGPTGVSFGFKTYMDAEAFAKGRNSHTNAFNDLTGWKA